MFRNALFTKSSVYVWANAFDNIGLDSRSILEDLNQPQLARLLFERRCSVSVPLSVIVERSRNAD